MIIVWFPLKPYFQIIRISQYSLTFHLTYIGVRFRAGLLGLAYDKMLRLKSVRGKQLSEVLKVQFPPENKILKNKTSYVTFRCFLDDHYFWCRCLSRIS